MKKLLFTLLGMFLMAEIAVASTNISDDFVAGYAGAASNLSTYNKDINTMIGLTDFHTGKATSFPGFDIGGTFTAVKVGKDNNISSEDYLMTGFLRAETFIPVANITATVRGTNFNGFESIGGGIKYTYTLLDLVHFSVSGFYDRAKTDWYTADHYSASAVASTSVVFFTPYVGVGYDYGELNTRHFATNRSTSDGALRYTAGVNVHPFPFVYLFAAYTKTAANDGFNGGLGISF